MGGLAFCVGHRLRLRIRNYCWTGGVTTVYVSAMAKVSFDPYDPRDRGRVKKLITHIEGPETKPEPAKPPKPIPPARPPSEREYRKFRIIAILKASPGPMSPAQIAAAANIEGWRVNNILSGGNGTIFLRVAPGKWRAAAT